MFRSGDIKASPNYKWWVVSAMALSIMMTVADSGFVAMALPTISDVFNSNLSSVQWLVTGQFVAISAVLLPMGRLADIVGLKKIYVWGIALFVIAAGLSSLASNLPTLILLRAIQGLGLGMVWGNQMAIMASAFPQRERGMVLGLHIALIALGGFTGITLGGVLVDAFGWRSVFWLHVPVGLAAILPIVLVLDEERLTRVVDRTIHLSKFDFIGAFLSTAGLVVFILAMTNGHHIGWNSFLIWGMLLGCMALIVAFILWELRCPEPMLDLTLFKKPIFSLGVIARFISFNAIGASFFLIPFYLQGVVGYSPTKAGLVLMAMPLGVMTFGALGGRLSDRYGWRAFNVAAAVIGCVGFYLFYEAIDSGSLIITIIAIALQGGGAGLFSPTNTGSVLSSVEKAKVGIASGFLELMRNSANVTGIVIATVIVTGAMVSRGFSPGLGVGADVADPERAQAFTQGLRAAMLVICGLQVAVVLTTIMQGWGARMAPINSEADV